MPKASLGLSLRGFAPAPSPWDQGFQAILNHALEYLDGTTDFTSVDKVGMGSFNLVGGATSSLDLKTALAFPVIGPALALADCALLVFWDGAIAGFNKASAVLAAPVRIGPSAVNGFANAGYTAPWVDPTDRSVLRPGGLLLISAPGGYVVDNTHKSIDLDTTSDGTVYWMALGRSA